MSKEISFSDEARNGLYTGVKKLADAVRVTMGPRGRNVILQRDLNRIPHITKDGVTVAKDISFDDPLEEMGARVVKEAASNTADAAGDGTTTATVLTHAILKEGLRNITSGANPIEVKRGMDKACSAIIQNLKEMSKSISNDNEITQVATISSNSDVEIGSLIAQAVKRVGNDGVISVEEAKGMTDELDVVDGTQFDTGYLSPYFVNKSDKGVCEMANPLILVADETIGTLKNLIPSLEHARNSNRPLLIVANSVEGEALNSLVVNKMNGVISVCAIKSPGYGAMQKEYMKDLCAMTGATLFTRELGRDFTNATIEDLGQAEKIVVSQNDTTFIGGLGSRDVIDTRINEIRNEMANAVSLHDKNRLNERLGRMVGGVAVIRLGAASDTEMFERRDRVDDALAATRAAIEEGILPGGGTAILNAANVSLSLTGDQAIGAEIVIRAVSAPIKQICENAGYDSGVIVRDVMTQGSPIGFNAATGEYVDMIEAGIIDPTKVVRIALENAVSTASLLMTTEAAVTFSQNSDSNDQGMPMPPM
jgi:chaperonin GroEL